MNVVSIGECMIEISRLDGQHIAMKFAGDTLNALVYLVREARGSIVASYMTALGDDPYSDAMLRQWREEGIDTRYVRRKSGKLPGLYIVENDASGERRPYYWRNDAAARQMFTDDDVLLASLEQFDLVYLSGITLAILPTPQRERLLKRLAELEGTVSIAFDPNVRPVLWQSPEEMRLVFATMFGLAHYLLISREDVTRAYDIAPSASVDDIMAFLREMSAGEIVLRRGSESCFVSTTELIEVPALNVKQVDATGAGDAFNGAYLAHRLHGAIPRDAATRAHEVAGAVVGIKGAIMPRV